MPRCISILGCGYLGYPLAQRCVHLGYEVKGSTTSIEKLALLKESSITPFLISCQPQVDGKDLETFFQSEVLFLNIPFRRKLSDPTVYKKQMESVISHVVRSPIQWVIFASSSSVYPAQITDAKEDVPFVADTPRSQVLYDTEEMLLCQKNFKTTVVRFAGLVGGARYIGQFLEKNFDVGDPQSPVNLIHLDDAVGLVVNILQQNIQGGILNAVCDQHPTREELYTQAALKRGLKLPVFHSGLRKHNRIVSNDKVKKCLNYKFLYPDPLGML